MDALAPQFTTRRARDDEGQTLAAYWDRWLGTRIKEIERWRAGNVVASGGSSTYVAESNQLIAGTMNVAGLRLGCRGYRLCAGWQVDSFVTPEFRRRGLCSRLICHAGDDLAIVAAKGTSEAMYTARKKSGFLDVPHSTYLLCPLRPVSHVGSHLRRLGLPLAFVLSAARRNRATDSAIRIQDCDAFGPEFDALSEQVLVDAALTPIKSAAYLTWRYLTCPGVSYRVLRADDSTGLRGAVVFRPPSVPTGDAWLVDLVVHPADTDATDTLLAAARESALIAGAAILWTFATSTRARGRLRRAGFFPTQRSPRFTYQVRAALPFCAESVEWNFWEGDGDGEVYR